MTDRSQATPGRFAVELSGDEWVLERIQEHLRDDIRLNRYEERWLLTVEGFDLDRLRTEICQDHRAVRAGQHVCQIQQPNAFERLIASSTWQWLLSHCIAFSNCKTTDRQTDSRYCTYCVLNAWHCNQSKRRRKDTKRTQADAMLISSVVMMGKKGKQMVTTSIIGVCWLANDDGKEGWRFSSCFRFHKRQDLTTTTKRQREVHH